MGREESEMSQFQFFPYCVPILILIIIIRICYFDDLFKFK